MNRRSLLAAFGALPLARKMPVAVPVAKAAQVLMPTSLKIGDVISVDWQTEVREYTVVSAIYASAGMRFR